MITSLIGQRKRSNNGDFVKEYYGLSSDIKPFYADGARNADVFFEMDTYKVYLFDQDNDTWVGQAGNVASSAPVAGFGDPVLVEEEVDDDL